MLDNDIEYIGTKRAGSPRIQMTGTSRAVTGFALNIEGTLLEAERRIVFHNDRNNRVIVVGRSPPPDAAASSTTSSNDGNAMFRCPVVSRKHAKFHFSNDKVFLTDSGSHHGTHILRHGSLTSTKLKALIATELADGDVITFGKTVKNKDIVKPVVVRVELLLQEAPSTSPRQAARKPLLLANDSSPTNAGRYGVFTSESSGSSSSEQSADEMEISSNSESEIEEVDPPSAPQQSPSVNGSSTSSIVDKATNAFKKLVDSRALPPISRLQSVGRIPYPFSSADLPNPRTPASHSHNQPSGSSAQRFVFGSPEDQPAVQSKFTFTMSSFLTPSSSQEQGQPQDQDRWGWASPWANVLPPIRTAPAAPAAPQPEPEQVDEDMEESESDSPFVPSSIDRLAKLRAVRPSIRLAREQKKAGLRKFFSIRGFGVGLAKDGSKSRSKSPLDLLSGSASPSTSNGKGDATVLSDEESDEEMQSDAEHNQYRASCDPFENESRESEAGNEEHDNEMEGDEEPHEDETQQKSSTTDSSVTTPEQSQPSTSNSAPSIPSLSMILQQHEEEHQTESIQYAQPRDFGELPPIPGYLPVSSPSAAELGFFDEPFPGTRFGGVDLVHAVDPWAYTPLSTEGKGKEKEVDVDVVPFEVISQKQLRDYLNINRSAEGTSCTPSTCDKEKAREKGWGHSMLEEEENDDEEDGDGNAEEDGDGDVEINVGPAEDSLFPLGSEKQPAEPAAPAQTEPQPPTVDVEMILADVNTRMDAKLVDINSRLQRFETSAAGQVDRAIAEARDRVASVRKEGDNVRKELDGVKKQVDGARVIVDEVMSGMKSNGDEVRKVRRDFVSLEDRLASAVREVKTARQALDRVKADVEKKLEDAANERNDQLDIIKSRADEGKKLVGDLEVMFGEVNSSRQEMTESCKKIEREIQSIIEIRKRLENLEEEYKAKVASATPPTVATGPSLVDAEMTPQPDEAATTLKRKRADGDDGSAHEVYSPRPLPKQYGPLTILGGTSVDGVRPTPYALSIDAPSPAPQISGRAPTPSAPQQDGEVRPPPRKRSRLMQTTVALAAGAAVTWTALAFS